MCGLGIVLSKKDRPAGQYAYNIYKNQESRGRKGYGFIAINNNEIQRIFRCKEEADFRNELNREKSPYIFFHHRLPTSTENTVGTTHPILVSHDELEFDYFIAHNGVIDNASVRKREHEKLGYSYRTEYMKTIYAHYTNGTKELVEEESFVFNDSESLAIELARFKEGKCEKVEVVGGSAFWGITVEKRSQKVKDFFFGRNYGRPLKHKTNKKWAVISSETGVDLTPMVFNVASLTSKEVEDSPLVMEESRPVAKQNTYSHYDRSSYYDRYYNHNTMGFRDHRNKSNQKTLELPVPSPYSEDVGNIEKKKYTYSEAVDTGVPLSSFYTIITGNGLRYIPLGDTNQTKQPNRSKEYDKLEECVNRIIEVEEELADAYEECEKHDVESMEYAEINIQCRNLEAELSSLEDKTAGLGLPEGEIEEYLDLAREIASLGND